MYLDCRGQGQGTGWATEPGRCRDMTDALSSLISPLSVLVSLSFDLAWLVCSHHLSEIPCAWRKWPQNHTKHERFCAENMEQSAAQLWAKTLVLSRTPTPDAAWFFAERCQGHPFVARERHRGASKRGACRSAHAVRRSRDHIRAGDESPPRNWFIALVIITLPLCPVVSRPLRTVSFIFPVAWQRFLNGSSRLVSSRLVSSRLAFQRSWQHMCVRGCVF